MARGMTARSFCGKIDIHEDTFYEWVKVHEDFSEAYKRGKVKQEEFLLEMGYSTMLDKGAFNTTAWIFLMKALCKYQDRVELEGNIKHQVVNLTHEVDED
jgi:hypothetical protein